MNFEANPMTLSILFFTALCGGFVDSIAGGGGLISIPVLMAMGFPPHLALGTNKLQASFGSFTATHRYIRSGLVNKEKVFLGVFFTLIGACSGTILVQKIPITYLEKAIPFVLAGIFAYTLLSPQLGEKEKKQKIATAAFYIIFGLLLGFYDGFFGPGTGSFWTIAFVGIMGFNLKSATANTKIMNFTSNIVALTVFIIGGKVLFLPGLIMGAGQVIGAWTGSHLVINKGTRFIRIFFLCVVALTIAKLFHQEYLM